MGIFWDYFRKTLRFPLIWNDGPLSMLVKGASTGLDATREDITGLRKQALPELCDPEYLEEIAAARGVSRWENEPDDFWRTRVSKARSFNFKAGKRVGLTEILALAGIEAEIWEPKDVKAVLAAANVSYLDGSWKLDGKTKLTTSTELAGLPYIAWAEFAVRINLGSMDAEGQNELLKQIVYEYKPARSLPKFVYWLKLESTIDTQLQSMGHVSKRSDCRPLQCATCLDGSWSLGWDEERLSLDGSWELDGKLKLGQVIRPAIPERTITDCRLATRAGGGNRATVHVGYPADTSNVPYFTLSNLTHKLDGMWPLGADNRLDGTWDLAPGTRLSSPCLGEYPAHRLGKGLKLGYKEPESGSWPQIGGGIYGNSNID